MFTFDSADFCYHLDIGEPPAPHPILTFFQLSCWWASKVIFTAHKADFQPVLVRVPTKSAARDRSFLGTEVGLAGWEN